MSDDNSPVVEEQKKKRGRPAKADKNAVKEPKKRGRPAAEKNNAVRPAKSDNEDDAPPGPVKKGRGRPKGSHKKKVYNKYLNVYICVRYLDECKRFFHNYKRYVIVCLHICND